EAVVEPAAAALGEPGRLQLLGPEPVALGADEHPVPRARRVADPELAQHLLPQAAADQVVARLRGLLRVPEELRVVAGRAIEQLGQPLAPSPALLGLRIVVLELELDPVAVAQQLDRL